METSTTSLRVERSAPIPALALLAFGTLLGSSACSSTSGSERATEASKSMEAFNVSTIEVRDEITETIGSLNALIASSGDEVKPSFAAFQKNVSHLTKKAEVVRTEAAAMREHGEDYFEGWEAGSSSMSEERHAQLSMAYAKIQQDMTRAKTEFEPFLASLRDVESYLSLDLTAEGLDGVEPLAQTATAKGEEVKGQIDAVLLQVNSVRGMISPGLER